MSGGLWFLPIFNWDAITSRLRRGLSTCFALGVDRVANARGFNPDCKSVLAGVSGDKACKTRNH